MRELPAAVPRDKVKEPALQRRSRGPICCNICFQEHKGSLYCVNHSWHRGMRIRGCLG